MCGFLFANIGFFCYSAQAHASVEQLVELLPSHIRKNAAIVYNKRKHSFMRASVVQW